MKTSINRTNSLFEKAKRLARQKNTSVRALIEEGLRRVIETHESPNVASITARSRFGRATEIFLCFPNYARVTL